MENWLKNLYLGFRLICLDVVFGAFAGLLFTTRYLKSDVDLFLGGIFALSVWIIYATDHLLDGLTLKDNGVFKRHTFFYNNRVAISVFLVLAILGDIYLIVFHLPKNLQITGGILGFLVIVYMFTNHYIAKHREINFFKEFFIAFIYSAATWAFPFVTGGFAYNFNMVPGFLVFFLIILQNSLIYSYYEYDIDSVLYKKTLPYFYGKEATKTILLIISVLVFGFSIYMAALFPKKIAFVLAIFLIEIVHTTTILFEDYFHQKDRYGIVADASIFLMSICTLF